MESSLGHLLETLDILEHNYKKVLVYFKFKNQNIKHFRYINGCSVTLLFTRFTKIIRILWSITSSLVTRDNIKVFV